jgi:hypothetical protein
VSFPFEPKVEVGDSKIVRPDVFYNWEDNKPWDKKTAKAF